MGLSLIIIKKIQLQKQFQINVFLNVSDQTWVENVQDYLTDIGTQRNVLGIQGPFSTWGNAVKHRCELLKC